MKALLFETLPEKAVQCRLCNHYCRIQEGKRGICGVRENHAGTLQTLVYGSLIANHVDPIEKKPLYHVAPGSLSYSIATVGCNFKCRFCQNAQIAQMPADYHGKVTGTPWTPEQVVADALQADCRSIAYTYTEPTVYFEFAYNTARLAREKGLLNVFVTNGYMSLEAIDTIAPFLNAANVDLKAYTDVFYKKYCGAKLEPVKASLIRMKQKGIFIEVTTLLIPGLNDEPAEMEALAGFIADSLGPETPWHISRFHPTYRLTDRQPTPVHSLVSARDIGLHAGLKYVYLGNVPGRGGENTNCPACGSVIIERFGFTVNQYHIIEGACGFCKAPIHGLEL